MSWKYEFLGQMDREMTPEGGGQRERASLGALRMGEEVGRLGAGIQVLLTATHLTSPWRR